MSRFYKLLCRKKVVDVYVIDCKLTNNIGSVSRSEKGFGQITLTVPSHYPCPVILRERRPICSRVLEPEIPMDHTGILFFDNPGTGVCVRKRL